jgi:DNA recombination protein RmuC
MSIFYFLSGLLAGAAIVVIFAWLRLRNRQVLTREQKEMLDRRISSLEIDQKVAHEKFILVQDDLKRSNAVLEDERNKNLSLNKSISSKESEFKALLEKLETQKKEVEELHEKLNMQFRNLANEILEEKSRKFTDQNKLNIAEVLNPLKEKIIEFEKKVEQTNKESIDRNASLKEQILNLRELNQRITRDAENLTKALKGESKSQGTWGEFILEKILEKSGLTKDREYVAQESHTSEDGRRFQPDVIIRLPEDKTIIIDSKVSLVDYERFVNEEDEDLKKEHLKSHIQSIRTHIKSLSEKNYQDIGVRGLDFVLLFMPVEPAFSVAIQNDDRLFLDAYERNIVIVSPTTLIATLRTIASIWRQEYQNRNAMEIAKQGGDLYDKFKNFTDDLMTLGDKLDSTQKTYEEAMKKLSSGTGNLVKRAEKLKKLGAKVKNSIDSRLLEAGENETE